MRWIISALVIGIFLQSCNNKNIPDVSNININLTTHRFEKDLFTFDSLNFNSRLNKLMEQYPSFGENFLTTILNSDPTWSADSISRYVKGFTNAYKKVYDTSQLVFKDFTPYEKEIKKGLQFLKYYFPNYVPPQQVITYIGPLDGYGDILTDEAIIVGLHHHLGKDFSLYKSTLVQETYPYYISNRFEPEYVVVNTMKNIVLDMYPERMEDKPLVQQMVERGKRLYILNKLLPHAEEHRLIGYTPQQLKDAFAHERVIWDLFVKNNFLQTIDNNIIKNYLGESPKTQELGEASPGNIGSFAGWQIVKKYMNKNPKLTLRQLMSTDAEIIFGEAKYKP